MSKVHDIGIIGAGVAGAFAALRASEKYKNNNVILFDLGRPPGKRRRQLEGWLGCFPGGDGKIHLNDADKVKAIVDSDRVNSINNWVQSKLSEVLSLKIIKDKMPQKNVQKRANKLNFEIIKNNYIQWKPENVHKLSKIMSDKILESGNVELSFDNEVYQILKKDNVFNITTSVGDFKCNKVILCVGRSGWRWANDLYKSFGMINSDDFAYLGIRVECAAQYMNEFNKSHCSFIRDDLMVGPLCWNGAVIPEDHADVVISSFRSNEERWNKIGKDKVSFNLIGKRYFPNKGILEMDRLAKLAFLMFNDRVGREKIKSLIKKDSMLSQIPEYDWLIDTIKELEELFPSIISRGYYHSPTIQPQTASILLDGNLKSEVDGLYIAGESANLFGILSAAISGTIAIDSALK